MKAVLVLLGITCLVMVNDIAAARLRGKSISKLRAEQVYSKQSDETKRFIRSAQIPVGQTLFQDAAIGAVLRNPVRNANLVSTRPQSLFPQLRSLAPRQNYQQLSEKLPSNFTKILNAPLVDSFSCKNRKYGYYADPGNNCQIFHVCLNFNQIWPANFTSPDLYYQFSFICNKGLSFSQDSLTCAWSQEAIPCEMSEQFYFINDEFFKIPPEKSLIG